MDAIGLIEKILSIVNEPNESYSKEIPSTYNFFYTRNIKPDDDYSAKYNSNPRVTLMGDDKIYRYEQAFEDLYNEMKISQLMMSLKFFKELVQQLFFECKVTDKKIIDEISKIEVAPIINIAKIYGVKLNVDTITFGKYLLINKHKIIGYIEENIDITRNIEIYDEHTKSIYLEEAKDEHDFVYCICKYDARDLRYADELFTIDKNRVVSILRYMIGLKHKRVYVDLIKFIDYRINYTQIKDRLLLYGMKIERKDISIELSDPFFNSIDNANAQIWRITIKENLTNLDKRILKAIDWIGLSVGEKNNNVACTEIAFAFESLFKINESLSPITSSIQGQIAETVAFLIGNSLEERLNIIKQFKEFYSHRSSVAHGGDSLKTGNYYEYLNLFKNAVITLLTDKRFVGCNSIEQVSERIKEYKFRD